MYCRVLLFILLPLLLASCAHHQSQQDPSSPLSGKICTDPRPEICTMDYNPVCGLDINQEKSDFPNACSACSNAGIVSWVKGPCRAE